MKSRSIYLIAVLAVGLVIPLAAPGSQQKAMSQKEMMDMQMKYSTPVKEHEYLKNYAGDWTVEVKTWMQPGTEPAVEKGSMKGELIYGGRFVTCRFDGSMMGQPFMGMQVLGYDLFQKKYVGCWIDSMSTHFSMTKGSLDATGKILTETGMWPDAMTGGIRKVRAVTTWIGDGNYKYEMYMTGPDGKEAKSMEIVYTRKV